MFRLFFMKIVDLSGRVFGRLTVSCASEKRSKSGDVYWNCVCQCGTKKAVVSVNLKNKKTQSCGCLSRELSSERAKVLFTKPKKICFVDGCENDTTKGGHGYCGKHFQRYKRHGDPTKITSESERAMKSRLSNLEKNKAKTSTYKKFYGRHEHRVIGEQIAGRPLQKDEHVHHVDGNKHNNHPSNLVVLTAKEHGKLHSVFKKNAS